MLAFERGLALGADALEFDVRLSSDGIPVVIHDATLGRTTGVSGAVGQISARDLQTLDAGSGQGIPLFENVLEEFDRTPLLIEVKEIQAAKPVAELIRRFSAEDRVVVGSFLQPALECFVEYGISRCASRKESAMFWLGSRVGAAIGARGYEALSVPLSHRGIKVVDKKLVKTAVRRGWPVHVWTIDDPGEAARLRELGIAGIITNWPDRMTGLARS
jgi:glycerophosphoryl diester phosphodiesterase